MSIIKSISVGEGDMFYIDHNSDSFSVIDCCMDNDNKDKIINEIRNKSQNKGVTRFISTHPDEDHLLGLKDLNEKWEILNFYCVENNATKPEPSSDFEFYCNLRDGDTHFYIFKGCSRKWINISDTERGGAGIKFLWPITDNEDFKKALSDAAEGIAFNNLSPIFTYSLEGGSVIMWMGDMEHDFREKIKGEIRWPKIDILFAPHHGRESGKVSEDILKKLDPYLIIIGEAPSKNLDYYQGYNTITQNSAGDIIFKCENNYVHIYVSNKNYNGDTSFLINEHAEDPSLGLYLGSFKTGE